MNKIHTLELPQASNNDISAWADVLQQIGFTKIIGDDTKIRWKNSSYGMIVSNNSILSIYNFETSTTLGGMGTITNITSGVKKFDFRKINDGDGIIWGVNNVGDPTSTSKAFVKSNMEQVNEDWIAISNTFITWNSIGSSYITLPASYNTLYYPDTAVQYIKPWLRDHFSDDFYLSIVHPVMRNYSMMITEVDNKKILLWNPNTQATTYMYGFDITDEEDEG